MDVQKINQIDSIDGRGMSQEDTEAISSYIEEKKSCKSFVQETPLIYSTKKKDPPTSPED